MYAKAIQDLFVWLDAHDNPPVTEQTCQSYLSELQSYGYAPATVNQRLSALRKVVAEAAGLNLLPLGDAVQICRIRNVRPTATAQRIALSHQKTEELINVPDPSTVKGKRDRLLLALLIGCALRRGELVNLDIEDVEFLDNRPMLIRVNRPNGRRRSVLMPAWVQEALVAWLLAAHIDEGPILRAVSRQGEIAKGKVSSQTVLDIVRRHGKRVGLTVNPEDLRRTCAKLCKCADTDLDSIRLLLGHTSLTTTERYLCDRKEVATVSNRRVKLRWRKAS